MSKKATKTQTPRPRTKPTERMCRYVFNKDELLDIGKRLAESQRTLAELEADKSRVMKDYASRISAEEANGGTLVTCISSGYEMRKLPCTVTFHDPKTGMKTTRRDDTGEVVDVTTMYPDEMQEELPLAGDKSADKAEMAEPEHGGFEWDENDGLCANPAVCQIAVDDGESAQMIIIEFAQHGDTWARGIKFPDEEQDFGEMLEAPPEGVYGEWPLITGIAYEDVLKNIERRVQYGTTSEAVLNWWRDNKPAVVEWLVTYDDTPTPGSERKVTFEVPKQQPKKRARKSEAEPEPQPAAEPLPPLVTASTPAFEAMDKINACDNVAQLLAVRSDETLPLKWRVQAEKRMRVIEAK